MSPAPSTARWLLPVLWGLWGVFAAFCASGFPPAVDLAAHGAQVETLKNLFLKQPDVSAVYTVHFPWGYGLIFWLSLPIAFLFNGAVAVKVALFATLILFPVSWSALARALGRSQGVVFLALPLAFNFSYWYGLLPGLFAQPLVFLALAAYARALEVPRLRTLVWLNVLALATLASHLFTFFELVALIGALALAHAPRRRSFRLAAWGLLAPLLVSVPKTLSLGHRAVASGPWPATEYVALSHLNWFFKTFGPEGKLAAWGPLLAAAVFAVVWLGRRKREPRGPAALFFCSVALYALTPKTLSGIYLVHVRLAVFAGAFALFLVDFRQLPQVARSLLVALALGSLVETAVFHWRFNRALEGLSEMIVRAPPGRTAYFSTEGNAALGSKHIYLEHLGQWFTAARGGVGHNFFADAEHHPVHFLPGVELPPDLARASPAQIRFFDQVLVYGDGPLLPALQSWPEVLRFHRWRLLRRP